jgi:hypothetical protein
MADAAPMDEARQDALAAAIGELDAALARAQTRFAQLAQRRAAGTGRAQPPALKRETGTGNLRLSPGQARPKGTGRTAPPAGDPLASYERRRPGSELERLVAEAEAETHQEPGGGA